MAGSGLRVNFYLRPAKHIERKMLCEAFSRLTPFQPIQTYRYIGFGAFYFVDFSLLHRSLGITNMVSIESDPESMSRCFFNRPLACIRLELGTSDEVLPRLPWNDRTILWLDYDEKLDKTKLSDVKTFCSSAPSGSILILTLTAPVSVDLNLKKAKQRVAAERRFKQFREDVGSDVLPLDMGLGDLTASKLPETCRRILNSVIDDALGRRNGGLAPNRQLFFKQLFNFQYADGVRMLTLGGVLYEQGDSNVVEQCRFDELDFVRSGSDPYEIKAPPLTYREIHYLNSLLPSSDIADLHRAVNAIQSNQNADQPELAEELFSEAILADYAKLYRYYPTFAESIL